jgi:hypothetical protein
MQHSKIFVFLFISLAIGCKTTQKQLPSQSEWAHVDKDGKLNYKKTAAGDQIMDFSHAGYMGGGVALPVIPAVITVNPSGSGDDTKAIQQAIERLASMPLKNGFRGAVQLSPGIFTCGESINLSVSGVVLRGSGSGSKGTTIKMVGPRHTAIVIGNPKFLTRDARSQEKRPTKTFGPETTRITDDYVPSGSSSFTVEDVRPFSVGDLIEVAKPVTANWLNFMQMDNMYRDKKLQVWIDKSQWLTSVRRIKTISNNTITLDVPLSDSYNPLHMKPESAMVSKIQPPNRVTQVGVENLHVQCPPLEIAFAQAPYTGIRVDGDDCWVKDVFFEETMNTTRTTGSRVTLQEVIVKHTYPNLGAAKPSDFSIEGSQILIDRCEATGGNTYFVWTSDIKSGPNVVLNSVFKGFGSRIQPHQRWSTGLLIDNCVIRDGGIDFINRGVAGSGHGWTIGWSVAWNCVADSYIIQNPPGVLNWAIGSVGRRMQTARLFDSKPLEPEGIFDSHGAHVAPKSLYLAQLRERMGDKALANLGYSTNTKMATDKNIPRSMPLKKEVHPGLGLNLASHRPISVTNIRHGSREFGGEKAVDANNETYWATADSITTAIFELDTEGPLDINAISVSEYLPLGSRVKSYKIEAQVDSDWKLLAEGSSIGKEKIHQFQLVTVWKVKLTILSASAYPAINNFGLYHTRK